MEIQNTGPGTPHKDRALFWSTLAALPFFTLYLSHAFNGADQSTGFIHHDQPYYSANGREIFERGNGLGYPNPYDPDPKSPVIYFHWLPWLLGFGIKQLGFDPGLQNVGFGIVSALLCSWLTLRLVGIVLPERSYQIPLFLFVMWGGGFLCLAQMADNFFHHAPLMENPLAYDPGHGLWFLSWGRNLIFGTESLYHAIVVAVWIAVLRERWKWALLGLLLLASTHPFTGLQYLLVLFAWFSLLLLMRPSLARIYTCLSVFAILAGFLCYYFVFLVSFEQHKSLMGSWALPWTLPLSSLLLAHAPIALLAAWRIWQDRLRLDFRSYFFVINFLVSFLLAKHEWFLQPHQPLHFTRGYIWMPLCLLGLPLLQRFVIWVRSKCSAVAFILFMLPFIFFAVLDNALFLMEHWRRPELRHELYLSNDEREMYRWMDREELDGVLLCPYPDLSYLSATYTSTRPYFGHTFNTPDLEKRIEQINEWVKNGLSGIRMNAVDYLLLKKDGVSCMTQPSEWELRHENSELALFQHVGKRDSQQILSKIQT